VAILEFKSWGGNWWAKEKVGGQQISVLHGDFPLFWRLIILSNPTWAGEYRWIRRSVIIDWRHRHATRRNHILALLCRIFCADHATSTALHM